MKNYKLLIQKKNIPKHVAIIMDGNGRWAEKHGFSRSEGHRKGAEIIEPLVTSAKELGIKAVSLYAFSTENWVRPRKEILGLWNLLEFFFTEKLHVLQENDIRVKHSGLRTRLPKRTSKIIDKAIAETKINKSLVLNFCINYGGRQEILEAVNSWAITKKDSEKITEKKLEKYLYTSDLPDVDLLVRTSGEYRISNFLIWQLAYTELVFLDVLWPDFKPNYLYKAVHEFQQRNRRYGGI